VVGNNEFFHTKSSSLNNIQGDHKVSVHLTITVQKNKQKYSILNSLIHLSMINMILNKVFENAVRRGKKCL